MQVMFSIGNITDQEHSSDRTFLKLLIHLLMHFSQSATTEGLLTSFPLDSNLPPSCSMETPTRQAHTLARITKRNTLLRSLSYVPTREGET